MEKILALVIEKVYVNIVTHELLQGAEEKQEVLLMRKKVVALALAASMALGLLAGCGGSSSTAGSGSLAGTYEGTGEGRNGDIVVAGSGPG